MKTLENDSAVIPFPATKGDRYEAGCCYATRCNCTTFSPFTSASIFPAHAFSAASLCGS